VEQLDKEVIDELSEPAKRVFRSLDYRSQRRMLKKARMIYEINKIGVNINQIAKKYNEHQYVESSADLLDKLDEVYQKNTQNV
jgi:hypothetical protein